METKKELMDEANEISDEDLEAAAEMFDRLFNEQTIKPIKIKLDKKKLKEFKKEFKKIRKWNYIRYELGGYPIEENDKNN